MAEKTRLKGDDLVLLALCIEKVLLDETSWNINNEADGAGTKMSVANIRKAVQESYGIDASTDKIRKALEAMHRFYDEAQYGNGSECLFPGIELSVDPPFETTVCNEEQSAAKATAKNCKRWFRLSHLFSASEVEHLVILNRTVGVEDSTRLESKLLSLACETDRLRILEKVDKAYGRNENVGNLVRSLSTISQLQAAIDKECRISFNYRKASDEEEALERMLPYCIGMNNGQYYLITKSKGRGAKKQKHRMFRIDRITNLKLEKHKANEWPENYQQRQDDAELYMRAAVNGIPSEDTVAVTVRCRDASKINLVKSEFAGHPEFEQLSSATAGHPVNSERPEFRFQASSKGMILWALKTMDAVEVIEPEELRSNIIKMISNNLYGSFKSAGTE